MTKQDVVDKCTEIYNKIEEIASDIGDLNIKIKDVSRLTEELPDDEHQIEDSEKEEG